MQGKNRTVAAWVLTAALAAGTLAAVDIVKAQEALSSLFRVEVDLVVLNVTVTDRRGRYIKDLKPAQFRIFEDGVPQQVASFGEGNAAPLSIATIGSRAVTETSAPVAQPAQEVLGGMNESFAGTNVFILFDTSNFMYLTFVYAEDAIADFIRGLDKADSVALYGFSRNLTRHAGLTDNRLDALKGLRSSVAGDQTALYNALLLTLRDAAEVPGRKVVIVFSNGPDTASTVGPDDVGSIAEDEGIPIYVISTKELNRDAVSSNAFRRITSRTGGRAFFAKTWQRQSEAFVSIKDELESSYTLAYYPQNNPNSGWRNIEVELTGDDLKRYRIRTRNGYRPKLAD
ncbi:MAG: VWA domain-containing protein [Acidobacteria bacterium]|nr:VWA domain-containing protein [Acidobacteriota bacterium]MDA1235259.1 VWA domain-containing protein [Acidobacteriota bacterium]